MGASTKNVAARVAIEYHPMSMLTRCKSAGTFASAACGRKPCIAKVCFDLRTCSSAFLLSDWPNTNINQTVVGVSLTLTLCPTAHLQCSFLRFNMGLGTNPATVTLKSRHAQILLFRKTWSLRGFQIFMMRKLQYCEISRYHNRILIIGIFITRIERIRKYYIVG